MKLHYFIESKGKKSGPFSLEQLKNEVIYEDDLIWNNGIDKWIEAKNLPELLDIIVIKPPKTPLETVVERIERDNFFIRRAVIRRVFWVFVVFTIITTIIANINTQAFISESLRVNKGRYMHYFGDSVFTRSIRSAFNLCTIRGGEYESDGILFMNLLISSMFFYSVIFIPLGLIYYYINRSTMEHYKHLLKP